MINEALTRGKFCGPKNSVKQNGKSEKEADDEGKEKSNPLNQVFSRVRELLQLHLTRVIDMFRSMDANGDGVLTKKELAIGLRNIGMDLSRGELNNLWNAFDRDHSGSVEYNELYQVLRDSSKSTVDPENMLHNAESSENLTAKERKQIEYQLRVQRGKKEADRERAAAIKRIKQVEKARREALKKEQIAKSEMLTQRTVQSKTNAEASRRARALARKRIADRKKRESKRERKTQEEEEVEKKRRLVEKQGLAALGHQKIVKRLNRRIKEAHEIKRKANRRRFLRCK